MTITRLARTRNERKWALGEREPLNDSERIKRDEAPLNVRTRIENFYAEQACSGIEFCKLSFAETRVRAQTLVPELGRRLDDVNAQLDVPITVYINGCPNSCARIQIADIGFKGQIVDDGHGGSVEGFQVHLGGSLGAESGFSRKLRQHNVFGHELGDYIDRVVRNFLKHRHEGERFATWAMRSDEEQLR
jgi:sulfite reductase (ferredoxin)